MGVSSVAVMSNSLLLRREGVAREAPAAEKEEASRPALTAAPAAP